MNVSPGRSCPSCQMGRLPSEAPTPAHARKECAHSQLWLTMCPRSLPALMHAAHVHESSYHESFAGEKHAWRGESGERPSISLVPPSSTSDRCALNVFTSPNAVLAVPGDRGSDSSQFPPFFPRREFFRPVPAALVNRAQFSRENTAGPKRSAERSSSAAASVVGSGVRSSCGRRPVVAPNASSSSSTVHCPSAADASRCSGIHPHTHQSTLCPPCGSSSSSLALCSKCSPLSAPRPAPVELHGSWTVDSPFSRRGSSLLLIVPSAANG